MFDLQGKYETARVFTDLCEQEATSQIINLLNQPFMKDTPKIHAGRPRRKGLHSRHYNAYHR